MIKVKEEVDLSKISFKYASYNTLRKYITGRMMYFNCRLNPWEDVVLTLGVYYNEFLCGGVLVSTNSDKEAVILTWYSREDRGKLLLLEKTCKILKEFGFSTVKMVIQKKYITELLRNDWQMNEKMMFKSL